MTEIPTAHQLALLGLLADKKPASLGQLGKMLDCTRANAKERLDALRKHGWVRVGGGDGDAYELTEAGKSWVRRLAS